MISGCVAFGLGIASTASLHMFRPRLPREARDLDSRSHVVALNLRSPTYDGGRQEPATGSMQTVRNVKLCAYPRVPGLGNVSPANARGWGLLISRRGGMDLIRSDQSDRDLHHRPPTDNASHPPNLAQLPTIPSMNPTSCDTNWRMSQIARARASGTR